MRASDVHEATSQHELFATLTREQIDELIAVTDGIQQAAEGEVLIREGETDDSMVVVLSGNAEVVKDLIRDREHVLGEVGSVAVLGELALLLDQPRVASVRCKGAVRYFRLKRDQYQQLLDEGNRAAIVLLEQMSRQLAERLREAVGHVTDLLDEKLRGSKPKIDLSSLKERYSRSLSYRL